jgi:hypothetical protein
VAAGGRLVPGYEMREQPVAAFIPINGSGM